MVARQEGRDHIEATLRAAYEIKVDVAGPDPEDQKELKVLGRIITFTPQGIQYEADPGHMESVVAELGLAGGKGVATPGVKDESEVSASDLLSRRQTYHTPHASNSNPRGEVEVFGADAEEDSPALVGDQMRQYQSLAARLNYSSMDRPDTLFSVKELMRRLSKPSEEDWTKLKRCARYLLSAPRLVILYPWRPLSDCLLYTYPSPRD